MALFTKLGGKESCYRMKINVEKINGNPNGNIPVTHDDIKNNCRKPPIQWATCLFPGCKSARDVVLTTHLHLAARLKKE
jgi:hypothetical protein